MHKHKATEYLWKSNFFYHCILLSAKLKNKITLEMNVVQCKALVLTLPCDFFSNTPG